MDIFTPLTMFPKILKGEVTQRNVLSVPYQRTYQLIYQQRTIGHT